MTDERHPPIDITTLAWEQPAPESLPLFDPDRDITTGDIIGIKTILDSRKRTAPLIYYRDCFFVASLFPQREAEFDPDQITLDILEIFQESIDAEDISLSRHHALYSLQDAVFLKTMSPIQFAALKIGPNDRNKLLENIKVAKENNFWEDAIIDKATLKALFPQETVTLNEDEWQDLLDAVKIPDQNVERLYSLILAAKIFFPERCHQLEPNGFLSRAQTQESLARCRRVLNYYEFLPIAVTIYLLTAKEVRVTDHGLEIAMPERSQPFQQEVPPMPPIKRY